MGGGTTPSNVASGATNPLRIRPRWARGSRVSGFIWGCLDCVLLRRKRDPPNRAVDPGANVYWSGGGTISVTGNAARLALRRHDDLPVSGGNQSTYLTGGNLVMHNGAYLAFPYGYSYGNVNNLAGGACEILASSTAKSIGFASFNANYAQPCWISVPVEKTAAATAGPARTLTSAAARVSWPSLPPIALPAARIARWRERPLTMTSSSLPGHRQ